MDLIRREALLNDLCEDREEGTFEFTDSQAEAADKIIVYVTKRINAQPSIPAVPLDKLCEWLEVHARTPIYNMQHTAEWWKEELERWMEKQDADRE